LLSRRLVDRGLSDHYFVEQLHANQNSVGTAPGSSGRPLHAGGCFSIEATNTALDLAAFVSMEAANNSAAFADVG